MKTDMLIAVFVVTALIAVGFSMWWHYATLYKNVLRDMKDRDLQDSLAEMDRRITSAQDAMYRNVDSLEERLNSRLDVIDAKFESKVSSRR